jgi:hypothetical protein
MTDSYTVPVNSQGNVNIDDETLVGGCVDGLRGKAELILADNQYSVGSIIDRNIYSIEEAEELDVMAFDFVPMRSNLLSGAWAVTEDVVRCASDSKLRVMAGVVWDIDSDNSFEKSHGIVVPSYFWKVIEKNDSVIAWLFPNSQNATRKRSEKYLLSVSDLENKISVEIPITDWKKKIEPLANWDVSESCIKKPQGPQAAPQG